jgi:hypothetical protein
MLHLEEDDQIVIAREYLVQVDVLASEPAIMPIDLNCGNLAQQVQKKGPRLGLVAVIDKSNPHGDEDEALALGNKFARVEEGEACGYQMTSSDMPNFSGPILPARPTSEQHARRPVGYLVGRRGVQTGDVQVLELKPLKRPLSTASSTTVARAVAGSCYDRAS